MTYKQLEDANSLKSHIDDLVRRISLVNDARGHILVIKAIGTPIEISVPEEMGKVILDMLDGYFNRELWDKREKFNDM